MTCEVDLRLLGLLQGSMGLGDALRDAGSTGEIAVRLGREDGLLLLKLVAGANDAQAEACSQQGRPGRSGMNSLKVANLTFEWPKAAAGRLPDPSRMFSAAPEGIGAPSNQNGRSPSPARFYGFEEETPALR